MFVNSFFYPRIGANIFDVVDHVDRVDGKIFSALPKQKLITIN